MHLRSLVRNSIDRPDEIIRDQDRSVDILLDVHRSAQIPAGLLDQPSLGERHSLICAAVLVKRGEHDAGADRRRAVPRAVLGAAR